MSIWKKNISLTSILIKDPWLIILMVKLTCVFQAKFGGILRFPRVGSPQASETCPHRLLDWLCGKNSDTVMPESNLGKWGWTVRPANGEESPPTMKRHLGPQFWVDDGWEMAPLWILRFELETKKSDWPWVAIKRILWKEVRLDSWLASCLTNLSV